MGAPTRRNALRLVAAAITGMAAPVVGSATPAGQDAALLDLCRQFEDDTRALRDFDALSLAGDPTIGGDEELFPLSRRWHEAMEQITAIQAKTPAGIAAKGAALGHALMQCVEDFGEQSEDYERLAMSLVRDIVPARAIPSPPIHPPAGPDAELISQCAEAMRLDAVAEAADDLEDSSRSMTTWFEVTDTIAATPAKSTAGIQAKAAIVRHLMEPMQSRWATGDNTDQTTHDPLVWSLVNDLVRQVLA